MLLLGSVEMRVVRRCSRKQPEESAGSAGRITARMSGVGCITSTIAEISGLGVKYWPAPDLVSAAFRSSRPLVGVALTSTSRPIHVSPLISRISRWSFAGS